MLYSHISLLSPLPIDFSAEVFSKILPKVIESKNLDGLSFLLFKMNTDNTDLLEKFFKELSLFKFSKDCIKEATNLLLSFLEFPSSFLLMPGLLMAFKPIIEVLVKEYGNDKRNYGNEEIFNNIYNSFDKRLGQDLQLDNFYCIISISIMSYNYNNPDLSEKFGMFIDLITSRMILLNEECIHELHKLTSNPKFCNLITSRPSFPE